MAVLRFSAACWCSGCLNCPQPQFLHTSAYLHQNSIQNRERKYIIIYIVSILCSVRDISSYLGTYSSVWKRLSKASGWCPLPHLQAFSRETGLYLIRIHPRISECAHHRLCGLAAGKLRLIRHPWNAERCLAKSQPRVSMIYLSLWIRFRHGVLEVCQPGQVANYINMPLYNGRMYKFLTVSTKQIPRAMKIIA